MNNKGSFKKDDSLGKRILGFFKESGFHIAIVVGLCALAAGAVFFSTNQLLTDPEDLVEEDPEDYYDGDDYSLLDDGLNIGMDIEEDFDDDFGEDIFDSGAISDSSGIEYADDAPDLQPAVEDEPVPDGTAVGQGEVTGEVADSGSEGNSSASNGADGAAAASGTIDIGDDDSAPVEDVVLAIVKPSFQPPLSGKIQAEYSMDKLVFSPTFNEWRTHSGVDISAPRGEVVKAIGNGAVSEIKSDPRYGFTVVIDHKNGYKSLYANLASDKSLKVGQEVKQGDPIGSVGATAIFESAEATHIHFELFKENKLVDPAAYIEFQK